ncbi:DUF6507 family protein [Cryobacterium sp.]|jgi:hypothetical protein|uniref:DUF6507 family protein n=1 Tax=Cryobacterium sp. TaxID=1926290 RepID=UPI002632A093|nr:DUF6507 family protein [Cryobacterium sp.]MCU1445015.1 hypothetical protein [Cryobacterium sp.]
MTSWSIDPQGVSTVLTSVETAATELSTALDGILTAQDDLVYGAGSLGGVPAAVAALIESEKTRLTNVGRRINAGTLGASTAAIAYVHGDEEMAASAQAAASTSALNGDMSAIGAERAAAL